MEEFNVDEKTLDKLADLLLGKLIEKLSAVDITSKQDRAPDLSSDYVMCKLVEALSSKLSAVGQGRLSDTQEVSGSSPLSPT